MTDIILGAGPCEKCGNWNEVVYLFPDTHPLAGAVREKIYNPDPYASDTAAYLLIRESFAEGSVIKKGGICMRCGCNSCNCCS